ncbi:S8 family peptidase [Deinococcus aerophilus]|uniref:Serine protease n=1 Tax=Deinococcus aerophilus TaxID=522488 RepID=A0ABQ2GLI8_9DEIO|nr:S8 family serine peptidase [Deinococcus aerophilus]GGM01985.1 serine protease [Deinococcus aerophilus]
MKNTARPLSCMALMVLALAVTSCGSVPPVTTTASVTAPAMRQLATVRVGPSVTETALLSSMPGAQILSFDREGGYAVVSLPAAQQNLQAAGLVSGRLQALDATLVTLEPDLDVAVQSDDEAESMGITTWAGGITTWAGGITTWAGGLSFLAGTNLNGALSYLSQLGIPEAHKLVPELGKGVKVAVLDTGVDLNHALIKSRLDTVSDWDYIGNDAVPQEEQAASGTSSKYGHGTGVAGVILQVAPNATLMTYRVLRPDGSGPLSYVVQAIDRAVTNGAQIINLSLGITTNSSALNTVIARAVEKGVLVVNSSGNTGTAGMVYPGQNVGSTMFPKGSGLIAVGSVGTTLKKSKFSSYAKNMSLTSFGENVLTAFPGTRIVSASGTSFAAPAVSGALALALSTGRAQPTTLSTDLLNSTTPNLDPTYNGGLGTGTLNVYNLVRNYR